MKTYDAENLLAQLNWRYATKGFDANKKISEKDWNILEQAVNSAPSSYGFQPYKFIVVNDKATREKLKAVSWNQPQITDASHLVVFAAKTEMDEKYVQKFVDRIAEVRAVPKDSLVDLHKMLSGFAARANKDFDLHTWAARQAYIALGFLVSSAAVLGIDACPMEGFDNEQYDKILGLDKLGLKSAVIATVGYRSDSDKYASYKKVRFSQKEMFVHI